MYELYKIKSRIVYLGILLIGKHSCLRIILVNPDKDRIKFNRINRIQWFVQLHVPVIIGFMASSTVGAFGIDFYKQVDAAITVCAH